MDNPLIKIIIPLVLILGVLRLAHRRSIPIGAEGLGIVPPPWLRTAVWVTTFGLWMLATDQLMGWRGPWNWAPWQEASPWVGIARVLAVALLGPIAEELIFRGILYARLSRTRVGPIGAIAILAAVWAAIHYSYAPPILGLLFLNGIWLGFARRDCASVIPPILMHIVWNAYAVW